MIKKCLGLIFAFITLGAAAAVPPMYQVIINNNSGFLIPVKDVTILYSQWCDINGNKVKPPFTQLNPGTTVAYVCETDATRGAFALASNFVIDMDQTNNRQIGCYLHTACNGSYGGSCTGGMQADAQHLNQGQNWSSTCSNPTITQPSGPTLGSVNFSINIVNQK